MGPRWHTVATNGLVAVLVLGDRRDWYARLADGRRVSITTAPQGAILEVTVPHGWDFAHRSTHLSVRAAKSAARDLLAIVARMPPVGAHVLCRDGRVLVVESQHGLEHVRASGERFHVDDLLGEVDAPQKRPSARRLGFALEGA
jgi:hypothetical protein